MAALPREQFSDQQRHSPFCFPFAVVHIHRSALLYFFPFPVAVFIAASGCRLWLPFGKPKSPRGKILIE